MDGDGLGGCDADAVGDAEDVGPVAVGDGEDADGAGDLDGDGEVLPGGVPGDVRVSIAGTMSAGTAPGRALGDDDALAGDADGDAPGNEAGPVAVVARVAAAFGWSRAAGECLAAPDRAKLTAADAASTLAVTPAAATGRHQRRRDVWAGPAAGRGDRLGLAGPNQLRPEAGGPEAGGPGAAPEKAGRAAAATCGGFGAR